MTTLHEIDQQAEALVVELKPLLEFAVTEGQIDVVEAQVHEFDACYPALPRALYERLSKPLRRHRRRVKDGNVCVPRGVVFPQMMVNGGSEAIAIGGRDYAFLAKSGFVPVLA